MSLTDITLPHDIYRYYMELPQGDKIQATYIWLGGTGADIRSKSRTLESEVKSVSELPVWNYDGSSTGQAPGKDSEVYLNPVAMYPDPFRRGNNILVLCEAVLPDGKKTPIPSNTRRDAADVMARAAEAKPWFGIEQEYTLFNPDGQTPLGWPKNGYPGPQGPYYCSNGAENSFGRRIVEAHYRACLYCGINISGTNGEVMPGQWEYQVGPCEGIQSGDQLWLSRYLMTRVCEDFNVIVSFDPKPKAGDWNGAGCHTNYSTEVMRQDGGYQEILAAIKKLEVKHEEHIEVYGVGNERRLTGAHETAPINKFSSGLANRGCSVRIPRQAKLEGKGYFEDRRPASNMDPYLVTAKIVKTTILDE
jgi:glutamine synthetase